MRCGVEKLTNRCQPRIKFYDTWLGLVFDSKFRRKVGGHLTPTYRKYGHLVVPRGKNDKGNVGSSSLGQGNSREEKPLESGKRPDYPPVVGQVHS